jgi:hypothetical protein
MICLKMNESELEPAQYIRDAEKNGFHKILGTGG